MLPKLPANPMAIGTRIVFEFSDGRRRAVEVHAGSGYLSHSAPQLGMPGAVRARVRLPDGAQSTQELGGR
ncbi:MAG: ASPIC/UnbV domain-containing protein [Planctomycetota bacterium]